MGPDVAGATPGLLDGRSIEVVADEAGSLWLFVGTDSGFEGLTQVFFGRIGVRLEPVPQP